MTPEQERLIAILQYLEDWDKLTRTPVTSVQDYLKAIDGRAQILSATRNRRDAELSLRGEYEQVVAKRTWVRLIENLRLDGRITRAITA